MYKELEQLWQTGKRDVAVEFVGDGQYPFATNVTETSMAQTTDSDITEVVRHVAASSGPMDMDQETGEVTHEFMEHIEPSGSAQAEVSVNLSTDASMVDEESTEVTVGDDSNMYETTNGDTDIFNTDLLSNSNVHVTITGNDFRNDHPLFLRKVLLNKDCYQ